MNNTQTVGTEQSVETKREELVIGFHGVRYQVADVARSVDFYTNRLGFTLEPSTAAGLSPTFRSTTSACSLSGPQASGSRPMPDGKRQSLVDGIASFFA
jgi:glyoxylase I family protein